jgi:hypothetical protein
MPINFPTTGLTANVTTYTYSGLTWIWTGSVWQSVGSVAVQGTQGTQGIQGIPAAQGIQGLQGSTGTSGIGVATSPLNLTGNTVSLNIGSGLTTSGVNLIVDSTIIPYLANSNTFTGSPQQITIGTSTNKGFIIKGATSQSANLQEWQDSLGNIIAKIDSAGNATVASITTLSGTIIAGSNLEITPLDNLYYKFDGVESRFFPTWQGVTQTITNPFRLLITLNGIIQSVSLPEYVWGSPFSYDGFILDSDGYMSFSEVPPLGTTFVGRIEAGISTPSTTYSYPFKAMDILLGAY